MIRRQHPLAPRRVTLTWPCPRQEPTLRDADNVLALEYPALKCVCLDLDQTSTIDSRARAAEVAQRTGNDVGH